MYNFNQYRNNIINVKCINCGITGHFYKDCFEPITSYGIICYKIINDKPMFLLIQRKHSISYIDFLRGKHNSSLNFIESLFSSMTYEEKNRLLTSSFDDLWEDLWINKKHKSYTFEYENAKKKFEQIKNGYFYNGYYINIKNLVEKLKNKNVNLEWGFPKGRRNKNENDLTTANREFKEETNLNKDDYNVENSNLTYSEEFLGSNGISYKYVYFIGKSNNINVDINLNNKHQLSEVGNIGWFSLNDACKLLDNNNRRISLLTKINDYIC